VDYKELAIGLAVTLEAIIIYVFNSNRKEIDQELDRLQKKIERIETGEFVEKIVKNVIYSPESRNYFKSIFSEALNHKGKNNDAVNLAILDQIEEIKKTLDEKK
jgi:hypothetical protein